MAHHRNVVRFINSDPVFYFVAKTAKNKVSIIPEFINNSVILPAPNVLQCLWKVPVVQSDLTEKNKKRFQVFSSMFSGAEKIIRLT